MPTLTISSCLIRSILLYNLFDNVITKAFSKEVAHHFFMSFLGRQISIEVKLFQSKFFALSRSDSLLSKLFKHSSIKSLLIPFWRSSISITRIGFFLNLVRCSIQNFVKSKSLINLYLLSQYYFC